MFCEVVQKIRTGKFNLPVLIKMQEELQKLYLVPDLRKVPLYLESSSKMVQSRADLVKTVYIIMLT